jgi:gamma-glutamyltranspeptidase / glutathione hydrolase
MLAFRPSTHLRAYTSLTALAAVFALSAATCAQADDRHKPRERVTPLGLPANNADGFKKGVVTAANPYGAEAGAKILEAGGNAIDAAVAIAYALNVVEPQSAGIGGGGFMLIHLAKSGKTFAIDTREKAPAAATNNMFVGVPQASLQGVAVGVPGMVRGTALAVKKYGNLSLHEVIQPAIELANDGFLATARYAAVSCNSRSQNSELSKAYFCPNITNNLPSGPTVGSLVTNKPLAETLRLIARRGPDCFYVYNPAKGCDIAKGIVEGQKFKRAEANSKGGSMDFPDLENYKAVIRKPIEGTYRGYKIKSMSPPSSGGLTIVQMLKMVERFPIGDASQGYGFGSPKTYNVMLEAMRLAFADRAIWMGDSDFADVPLKGLLHPKYVAERSAFIVPGQRAANVVAGDPSAYEVAGRKPMTLLAYAEPVAGPGGTTTHFSVVDKWGNVVSYTNTIESTHGIGVFAGYTRPDGTFKNHGFLLNNELTDFNTAPSTNPFTNEAGYNDVEPNKRPRSSMSPTMIFTPDGKPLVAYGSPGGATIINSVLNITLNLIDHRMTIQDAINAPRVSITAANGGLSWESTLPAATLAALTNATTAIPPGLGYARAANNPADIGAVQAVVIDLKTGKQYGGADARREGTVIGITRIRHDRGERKGRDDDDDDRDD